ncbi:MAG: glycoside hydrolase family 3 C-terminal domain-containing protein, partial [Bifidobacteriaceae bacterium]|nr:glycoside hydrolase family 3 C-terminal domain-containing protein [Bifidobacteriaceae bacterium]
MHLSRTASRATVAFGLATALSVSLVAPAGAYTPDYEPGPLEIANAELSRQVSAEGMVLLENLDRALPIAPSGNVALFGVGIYRTIPGGTGSGAVNNRVTLTVREGFERAGYAVTTKPAYYDAMVAACANLPAGGAYFGPPRDYSTGEVALTAASAQPTAPTDTAVYVLARNAGETYDRNPGKGDYYLADVERTNIETIARVYPRVIVALNVGGVVDTSFFADVNARVSDPAGGPGLDALLLMSQAGQEAGAALVDILAGGVTPSGKTADTWASSYDLYPAASTFAHADDRDAVPPSWFDPGTPAVNGALVENYSEGIYVGYRYFDSFYKTLMANNPDAAVNYPFGYGLSYTTFDTVVDRVEADMQTVTVEATVVNTGVAFSGKETVQVYFSAPQEGLDKPYQELVGFAKTDVLAPGASQKVTVEFATEELSSYDTARAAYTMQGGDYAIRVGNSSRNTSVAAVLTLGATLVVEQLSHQANDPETDADHPFVELESDPANFYTYPGEAVELRAAPRVPLTTAGFVAPNNASPLEQDKTPVAGSYLAETDGDSISATTAYIPSGQTNWEGTGSPYAAKEGETLQTVAPAPGATLFDVARGTVSMERFVAGLSATQLANIVVGQSGGTPSTLTARGAAGYTTMAYESLGIPAMPLADGPAGVRIDQTASNYVFLPYPPWFESTVLGYQWCTAWPIGTMLAQTWNSELVQQVGEAIGKEMAEYGVTLWLAPGTNLHRDPLNGRNFEYYSEDPLLSGMTAAAETKGVQSTPGVGVTLKHYAANNQETEREASDSVIRERALRELYLKSFEIAVKSAQPMAIMSSYNKVNGHYVAGDYDLLTDVLRGEWGFEGLVMSDWGGVRSGALTNLYSGNDLIVPGGADNVRDVVNLILPTSAVISPANGLPTCNSTTFGAQGTGYVTYSCTLGNIVPDPTGPIQISTWVAGAPASGSNSFTGVQASIDSFAAAADREGVVHWTGAPSGSIVVTALVTDPSGVVTDYRVDIKGVEALPLRLGDLQKSAAAILRIATQSATFAELAQLQSQSGISVSPYTAQFADLKSYVTSSAAAATVPSGPLPIVVEPAVSEPTSGWFTDSANIEIGADDLLAAGLTVRVRIDGGAWTAYSGAIEVTGDGDHTVEVSALDAFAAVVAA